MLQFSSTAISEIQQMQARQQQPDTQLRLRVQTGGCLDKIYVMSLDHGSLQPSDQLIDAGEIQVLVDADSLRYLSNLTVDYSEDLMGGGFRFTNREAGRTCGCGNSFVAATFT